MEKNQTNRFIILAMIACFCVGVSLAGAGIAGADNSNGTSSTPTNSTSSASQTNGIVAAFRRIKGAVENTFKTDVSKAETDLAVHIPGLAANFPGNQANKPKPPTPADPIPDSVQFEIKTVDGKKEIWATYPGGEQKISDTMTLPEGTPYAHWLAYDDAEILAAQGGYDDVQFDALFRASEVRPEAQGPGFYASLNPMDSSSYGPRGMMGYAPKDTVLGFSSQIMQQIVNGVRLGGDIAGVAERLRKAGVSGQIGDKNQNWMVFVSQKPVAKLTPMTQDNLMDAVLVSNKRALAIRSDTSSPNQYYSQGSQLINPIQAVQTYYMKGIGSQAPNDWTKKNVPAWDKMLRGEPLTDDERNEIDGILAPPANPNVNAYYYGSTGIGTFSKEDPHLANYQNYVKEEAKKIGGPEAQQQLSDFLAKEAPYNKAVADYQASPAYVAYQTAVQNYYKSPAFLNYQTASQAAMTTYSQAMQKFVATPAYQAYQQALSSYYTSPAFTTYQKASTQYQASYQTWLQQRVANPSLPQPKPPTMPPYPTPPQGQPRYTPPPPPPPLTAIPPPQPQLPEKPNPNELKGDALRAYQLQQLAEQSAQLGVEGPLHPTPLPTETSEQQKQVKDKMFIACIRSFFHL